MEANIGQPPGELIGKPLRKKPSAKADMLNKPGAEDNTEYAKLSYRLTGREKAFEFVDEIVGGVIPKEYIKPIEEGIREAAMGGALLGYEMVDFKVRLVDGSYHEVDSSEMAFKIAGSMAFKDAASKADPTLLEPMMEVEVIVPEEYLGAVLSSLSSRRGSVRSMTDRHGAKVILADVPLSEMFGYTTV